MTGTVCDQPAATERQGEVVSVRGSVVDVSFKHRLPPITHLLKTFQGIMLEVVEHLDLRTVGRVFNLFGDTIDGLRARLLLLRVRFVNAYCEAFSIMWNSTRRFFARPSLVLLSATGRLGP